MFRYSQRKFCQSLLRMGTLRVGTLHDFRRSEHKQGIADPKEGRKEVFHEVGYAKITDLSHPDVRAATEFGVFDFGEGPLNVTLSDVTFARTFDHPDCFILCSSSSLSTAMFQEFEGSDACIRIADLEGFYGAITETLNSITPVVFHGVHKVRYQTRKERWNGESWGSHPALIKEFEFANQHEIRAIWQPKFNQSIEPLIITNPAIGAACREEIF